MFLTKTKAGHFIPSDDKSYLEAQKIPVGGEIKGVKARNIKFLRKYFALISLGYENTDTKDSKEIYRMKIQMKAGFIEWSTDKDGEPLPFPESISFEKMSEDRFNEVFDAVLEIISGDLDVSKEGVEEELMGFY